VTTFDLASRCLRLRIVYDGAVGCGKTTNVRALGAMFASEPSPVADELFGRTLSFDWTTFRAGTFREVPTIATVLGAPGARGFEARRRHLLAEADAVVFVCESTREGVIRGRAAIAPLLSAIEHRRIPMVVQANQQDRPDSLPPPAVALALGCPEGPVLGAVAREGTGVVDTFLAALQRVHAALEKQDATPARAYVPPENLAAALANVPLDVDAASETLLELLSAELAQRSP
jgi:hypothetical protein